VALVGLTLTWWVVGYGGERRGAMATAGSEDAATNIPTPVVELEEPRGVEAPAAESTTRAAAREHVGEEPLADVDEGPLRSLVIEVVDPSGAPRAGIPLQLDPGDAVVPEGHVPGVQLTDARGRAVFAGMRETLTIASEPWTLRADLAFEEPPSLVLDRAALASSVTRFELPPGGPVDVVVRELDGTRAPNGSVVRLRLVRPEDLRELDLTGPEWKQPVLDGAAHFPWVELARDWELAAWRPKGSEPSLLRARGPMRLGARVTLELVLGSDHAVVSYRVLTPERTPLASAEIELTRSRDTLSVTTNQDGRFTIDARPTLFDWGGGFIATYRSREGAMWLGRASLPFAPANGWNDGGDIPLAPEPLLCAGRVVDERGAPVANAEVIAGSLDQVMRFVSRGGGKHSIARRSFGFHEERSVSGRSDTEGRFELRGLWIDSNFPVRASSGNASSPEITARQGDDDLVLALTPRFTISGELVVDPGVDPNAIRFALERPEVDRAAAARSNIEFEDQPERFELEPIDGGSIDLLFLLEDTELTRLAGLAVSSDLDLGSIDLRGRVHVCEVELIGEGDLSGLNGQYAWASSGEDERRAGSFHGALVRVFAPQVPIDIELRPRGYRTALLKNVSDRRRHTLEPPLRVRLVLQTSGTLPAPPYRFDAELYQGNSAVSEPAGPRWFTPERNEIECLVSTPGQLVARWHLEKKVDGESGGGAIGSHVLQNPWVTLDVRDELGVQVFTIEIDGEALNGVTRGLGW
jgi:hypothetical protein